MNNKNKPGSIYFSFSEIKKNIKDRDVVEYNKGQLDTNIAFVFACPGQEEKEKGKVVSGNTGNNLEILLQQLKSNMCPGICHGEGENVRYQYCITNASKRVYYKGYKGKNRTLPYALDVYSDENMNRLKKELDDKKVVICFGKSACKTIKKIKKTDRSVKWEIVETIHMGFQSLNRLDLSNEMSDLDSKERTKERLKEVAKKILKDVKRKLNNK